MSDRLGFQSSIIHCFSAAKKIVVIAARSILQSGNWLIKVLEDCDEGKTSSCLNFSTDVETLVPLIFGGAWAFAFTCKPPEDECLDLSPPRFVFPLPSLLPPESGKDEVTGKNEVAPVATIMSFYFLQQQSEEEEEEKGAEETRRRRMNQRKKKKKKREGVIV
jgi:hypothetical protein